MKHQDNQNKEPSRVELTSHEKDELLKRLKRRELSENDWSLLIQTVQAIVWIQQALQEKTLSLKRLLRIFGVRSEKRDKIFSKRKKQSDVDNDGDPQSPSSSLASDAASDQKQNRTAKGHGRLKAEAYGGADSIYYSHTDLSVGDVCPDCKKGRLYDLEPGKVLVITGHPPLQATVHRPQRLRCALCGVIFSADLPEHVPKERTDEAANAMVAILRYGYGLPHYRLSKMQSALGVPRPEATQWQMVEKVADAVRPVFKELKRLAAQGEIIYLDDTGMRLLEPGGSEEDGTRRATFTTGILSKVGARFISLFFTGQRHAGENMTDLLAQRNNDLPPPLQMCDALSRNVPAGASPVIANCLTHGRRNFADIAEVFPDQSSHVIDELATVYHHDALTRRWNMTPRERLKFHREMSGPIMSRLHAWLKGELEEKRVEPNSSLGKAMKYMLRHWHNLTRFLEIEDAPLTNDLAEQLLKGAIVHRKNSLFYKNQYGALIGDMLMSVIQTCVRNDGNPFDYLVALGRHRRAVIGAPSNWLPWTYETSMTLHPLH